MGTYKISAADKKREQEWRAESDLNSLKAAKEIMADGGRLKAAQAIAKKQMMALVGIVTTGKAAPKKKK